MFARLVPLVILTFPVSSWSHKPSLTSPWAWSWGGTCSTTMFFRAREAVTSNRGTQVSGAVRMLQSCCSWCFAHLVLATRGAVELQRCQRNQCWARCCRKGPNIAVVVGFVKVFGHCYLSQALLPWSRGRVREDCSSLLCVTSIIALSYATVAGKPDVASVTFESS